MSGRSIGVSFLPELIPVGALRGRIAVVVDLLRASSTIVQALHAGAASVVPCLTAEDALGVRAAASGPPVVLGGERGCVRIDGFDHGNSPLEYTPGAVGGRSVAFTTTNGTRAILACRGADRVLVGCYGNVTALVGELARDGRSVHVVCAGTRGGISREDCLCAGRVVRACREGGFDGESCEQAAIAAAYDEAAARRDGGVLDELRRSIGGRHLAAAGLSADIECCARSDWARVVPELDLARGAIVAGGGA